MTAYLDIRAKPDGQVGQPDNAGGVAGESNKLGFIEIFWNISGIKGINMAEDNSALFLLQTCIVLLLNPITLNIV